jgi:hypothetical protein
VSLDVRSAPIGGSSTSDTGGSSDGGCGAGTVGIGILLGLSFSLRRRIR